jgi:hypothetical protein
MFIICSHCFELISAIYSSNAWRVWGWCVMKHDLWVYITRIFTDMLKEWRMVSSGMLRRVAFVFLRGVRRLLVTASVVPSSPTLVTLMKEALSPSETSVLTKTTWPNIPEDTILHSHRSENLKSYMSNQYLKIEDIFSCNHSRHFPIKVARSELIGRNDRWL